MGRESRQNAERAKRKTLIIFPNDQLKNEYHDFMRRTAAMLQNTSDFYDAVCELDENAPDFHQKLGEPLEKFVFQMILNYPGAGQFVADLETLKNVIVR